MNHLEVRLKPLAAFGTPLKGDTLFGQLCWALINRHGEDRLHQLLEGYIEGSPFAVVSDAFPAGFWPRPVLPQWVFGAVDQSMRKEARRRIWLPDAAFPNPIDEWSERMVAKPLRMEADANRATRDREFDGQLVQREVRVRNSIDRRSNTTGAGFDPYSAEEYRFGMGVCLDCHIVYDRNRVEPEELMSALGDIGACGFGRDASIGLGRFDVVNHKDAELTAGSIRAQEHANAHLALAPLAPQGFGWDRQRSWYRPFTRFGRHGDRAVLEGQPFKTPLLLVDTGAVLTPSSSHFRPASFIGNGIGGGQRPLSRTIPKTVHQGYAPVLSINVPPRALER